MKTPSVYLLFCWVFLFLGMFILVSCDDSQERIDKTIEGITPNAVGVIEELKNSTPESLKRPRIIQAEIIERDFQATLHCRWIEKHPTPDAFRITSDSAKYSHTWKIEDFDNEHNNEMDERDFVLFSCGQAWRPDTNDWARSWDEWKELKNALMQEDCGISLVKDGQVISNTTPVRYIKGPNVK